MSRVSLHRTISHIGLLQVAIIILAVATALVHLDRGLMMSLFAPHFAGGLGPSAGHFTGRHPPSTGHFAGGPSPSGSSILRMLPLTQLFFLNFLGYAREAYQGQILLISQAIGTSFKKPNHIVEPLDKS